ncbi:ATP phosphoribosyltransferase [Rhodoligotrophos appendicifer]|uniref:ATP phosphoribosyltransferase n=1 Tax=Rhodoligotrophos appendicifer TaxID=987056 RepID=UPI0011869546|nr:ATP phosphoribosyltransferase [Rhodoligotrophos appendicifer]
MMKPLIIALPSKGRLMEKASELLGGVGLTLDRTGAGRGYQGRLNGIDGVEVSYLSATEIAHLLREGAIDIGITGEDLLREHIPNMAEIVDIQLRFGFGRADVIVAVPECWLDVATMTDLDEVALAYYARHGRRLRVATKYMNLTRRFFAENGVRGYRIVESLGATEGAPAAGTAEVIVDITSTGATLEANHLKILDDGVILKSEAVLAAHLGAMSDARLQEIVKRLA